MKKYLIISIIILIGISIFFIVSYNKQSSNKNTVAFDAFISIYVNDVAQSVDRLDLFLKQNYSFIESIEPQNEYTLVRFTIPYPSTDALVNFLSQESTDGVIIGQKNLKGVFEFEPKGKLYVNVEAKLIDVATLNT